MIRFRNLIFFSIILFTGCAIQRTPMPTPVPCEVKVRGECREQSASEKGGAVTRGHGEEIKDTKP